MKNKKFSSIENIIKIAKKGEMYILVDDENRENEGDLVIPATNVSQKNINFMAMYGRGLICLSLTNKQAIKLNLSLMSPVNKSRNQTAFTVSIEARKGVTTGISAKDRSVTIKTAIKPNVKKNEIISPGHIFPIISKDVLSEDEKILESKNKSIAAAVAASVIYAKTNSRRPNTGN